MESKKLEKQWLLNEKYGGIESSLFLNDLKKLESGTPLAYLIGNIPFLEINIDLEYKPLIPRPETEYWVDYCIKKYLPIDKKISILDLCSGSGCIGLAISNKRPLARIVCSDIDENNIKQIQKNIELNTLEKNNIEIIQSNLFENISTQLFDFICTNPPYISEKRKDTVEKSVIQHENPIALFASDDGLYFIKKIIDSISEYLTKDGYMFIEFDPWQKNLLEEYVSITNLRYEFLQDQYEKNRILIIQNKKLA